MCSFGLTDIELTDIELTYIELTDIELTDFELTDFELTDFELTDFELTDIETEKQKCVYFGSSPIIFIEPFFYITHALNTIIDGSGCYNSFSYIGLDTSTS